MTARRFAALWLLLCITLAGCLTTGSSVPGPAEVRAPGSPEEGVVPLPGRDGSLKFAVIGDFGTGERPQYVVGEQMARQRERFPFELVLTVGDNMYGSQRPRDFIRKFELPYKALLDAGVKFYASLGNHDSREQRLYKPFNMDGQLYYTFKAPAQDVRFFALESGYLEPKQIDWLDRELGAARERWKIPYFHHPLYSSGGRHGSDLPKRQVLEPLFIKHGVTVVFTGHDHTYERTTPQQGIVYFVVGSSGQLRRGNLRKTAITAVANDQDRIFLMAEIDGDEMHFNAVASTGRIVDSGAITRRKPE
jgi:hypothetical protein